MAYPLPDKPDVFTGRQLETLTWLHGFKGALILEALKSQKHIDYEKACWQVADDVKDAND